MRSTIQATNIELSKEELFTALVELNDVFSIGEIGQKEKAEALMQKYPFLTKLRKVLSDTWEVHDISSQGSTFRTIMRN